MYVVIKADEENERLRSQTGRPTNQVSVHDLREDLEPNCILLTPATLDELPVVIMAFYTEAGSSIKLKLKLLSDIFF